MMKLRMKTMAAGPSGVYAAGEVVTVSQQEAEALIAGGYAEVVKESLEKSPPIETATAEPLENAAVRIGKRKR